MKGKKTIHVVTKNQEKMRFSLILAVIIGSTKLPPYIIFTDNISTFKLTKKILNISHIKNKEIFFVFNENAWTTGEILID